MPAKTYEKSVYDGLDSPAGYAVEITPDNINDLEYYTRGLYVGTGGDVVVYMADDIDEDLAIAFIEVPSGTILPIRVRRVLESSTATDLVGLS